MFRLNHPEPRTAEMEDLLMFARGCGKAPRFFLSHVKCLCSPHTLRGVKDVKRDTNQIKSNPSQLNSGLRNATTSASKELTEFKETA